MKPLSIEELKALEVGDWIWEDKSKVYEFIKDKTDKFLLTLCDGMLDRHYYSDYGTKWLAYKNKEQAEEQEHCMICHINLENILPKVDKYGNKYCNGCYEAKCTLENLKRKQSDAKRDLYQTAFELILQDVYENRLQADTLSCSSCPFMEELFDGCQNQGLYEDCKKRWQEYYLYEAESRLAELKGEKV